MKASSLLLLALPLASACGGPSRKEGSGPPVPFDESWMAGVVADPTSFSSLVDDSREGWIAFHANRFSEAAAAFQGDDPARRTGRTRALWELHLYYQDLSRLGDLAWQTTFEAWPKLSTLPAGSALPFFAGLARLDAGDAVGAAPWLDLARKATDPDVVAAATALQGKPDLSGLVPGGSPLLQGIAAHVEARKAGDPTLLSAGARPVLEERTVDPATGSEVVRKLHDPLLLRTAALVYQVQATRSAGGDPFQAITHPQASPLASLLFSPVLAIADLGAEAERARQAPGTLGAAAPSLARLGLSTTRTATDDSEWARQQVRLLDSALDGWVTERHLAATVDGRALLDDLQLAAVFRSRLILAMARDAMEAGHPNQSLAFAYLALDLESAREVTPVNHPALQVLIAEAQLRTGHTREALDALQVLSQVDPLVVGLDEVVGDLAILQGLNRYGDSKEN